MAIIGGHERNSSLFRKTNQLAVDILFDGQSLILNFEKEIAFAENIPQTVRIFARLTILLLDNRFGHRPTKAGGERNQSFAMHGEQIVINARAVVEALEETSGNQLDEIVVALERLAEKHEMVRAAHSGLGVAPILAVAPICFFSAVMSAAICNVHFATDYRLVFPLSGFV